MKNKQALMSLSGTKPVFAIGDGFVKERMNTAFLIKYEGKIRPCTNCFRHPHLRLFHKQCCSFVRSVISLLRKNDSSVVVQLTGNNC